MPSISWSTILSIILPGAVALFALRHEYTPISSFVEKPEDVGLVQGIYLLILTALSGGTIEAARRVAIDELLISGLVRQKQATKSPGLFYYLRPSNLELFNSAVENSYKYYCFYANVSVSIAFLILIENLSHPGPDNIDAYLICLLFILSIASIIQYSYFSSFVKDFVAREKKEMLKGGLIMLENWPDPGAVIVLIMDVRFKDQILPAGPQGSLIEPIGKRSGEELPQDRFLVNISGIRLVVTREQVALSLPIGT